MMKLSMMYSFLESESPVVLKALEKWGYDEDSVGLVRASSNFIFIFEKDGVEYILRLTPHGNINQFTNEIHFLSFLKKNNVAVNHPMGSRNGNMVETITSRLGTFYAVVFNFVKGKQYEMEEINDEQFYLWGEALGNLHHHSKQYVTTHDSENSFTLQKLLDKVSEVIPRHEISVLQELIEIQDWMANLSVTRQNYGRIHFDFELDNLIWDGKNIQMIDFESSLDGWYVADIAFALRDLFPRGVDLSQHSFHQFLKGYKSKTKIPDDQLKNIAMFLRLHNLITFAKLLETLDMECSTNQPEWVEGLISKLQSKVEDYRASFKQL